MADNESEMADDESEMADDDSEMADVDGDASLKQVVWENIKKYLGCLYNSPNDKDRLKQMTKISIALFLHTASEEGTAMWRPIWEEDHLHSMFRGITAYRHLLHLSTAQFQTSNKDETEIKIAHQGCLIQARCHWWAGLSAFSEEHWNAMQQKVFRELNLENWRNIETNLAMLEPQERAMIEAALTAYNHARVLTDIRQEAQKKCKYCSSYMEQRVQREHGAEELLQTSPSYDSPMDLRERIGNFLEGNCPCCRRNTLTS
jgi:hypothetical protein